jgi:hypothetical protein
MRRIEICLATAIAMLPVSVSATEMTSAEYAAAGRRAFDAMSCAVFAEYADNEKEQVRLTELGIAQGRVFLQALRDGLVSNEDMDNNVPIAFTLSLGGPSVDFILGRFWERAIESASDKVWEKHKPNSESQNALNDTARKLNGELLYRQGNCASLR